MNLKMYTNKCSESDIVSYFLYIIKMKLPFDGNKRQPSKKKLSNKIIIINK